MAVAYGGPGFGYVTAPKPKPKPKPKPVVVAPRPVAKPPVIVPKPAAPKPVAAQPYDAYVKGFGGAQGYAKAIMDKATVGQSLSNNSAAQSFLKANPNLFTPGFSLTKPAATPTAPTTPAVTVPQGKSPTETLAEQLSTPVSYDASASPPINTMPYEQALQRAMGRLDPQYQQARTNAGSVNQQQQQLLKQYLNARGQVRGGLAQEGAIDLSQQLQNTLGNIDVGYNTQLAEMADAIQNQDFDRAYKAQDLAARLWDMQQQANNQRTGNLLTYQGQQETQRSNMAGENLTQQQIDQAARQFTAEMGFNYDQLSATQKYQMEQIAIQRLQTNNDFILGQGGLAISRGNLGVAQGNLAVSRGNLKLNQDQFDYDKTKDTSNPIQDAVKTILSDLSQMSPLDAYNELIDFPQDYIRDIGLDEYNKLLRDYKYAAGA